MCGIIEEPKGSGRWFVRIYHHGHRYKRRAASKAHARELREEIRVAIRKGEWPPRPTPRPALFDDLLDAYRAEKERQGKVVYGGELGWQRLREPFGGRLATEITTADVLAWRDELDQGLSTASVNRHLTMLRALLNQGVRDCRVARDKLPVIKLRRENNERVRHLSEAEEAKLLDAARRGCGRPSELRFTRASGEVSC
jgi:hypothetical protein